MAENFDPAAQLGGAALNLHLGLFAGVGIMMDAGRSTPRWITQQFIMTENIVKQQNEAQQWVYCKVDGELEMTGYHPLLEPIYSETEVEDSFPFAVGCCENILCTTSCEKETRIIFPLTIWCRIAKETAECTSDVEVRKHMEEALLEVPENTWRGCPVTLRILAVTRQECMDAEYQDFCDFMSSADAEEFSQQSTAAFTQQVVSTAGQEP